MKILIYDATQKTIPGTSWVIGSWLYRRRFDCVVDAVTWREALEKSAQFARTHPVDEVQYWGHGVPGGMYLGKECLLSYAAHHDPLAAFGAALAPNALVWFRVCAAFAGDHGKEYAERLVKLTQRRCASSTYDIALWHSGQHSLRPGDKPTWPSTEGLDKDGKPLWSARGLPNTIPFAQMTFPLTW